MAVSTRSKTPPPPAPAAAAELADLKAAIQAVARITAKVASRPDDLQWTDFRHHLLRGYYGITDADAELFMDILNGRKP